MTGKFGLKSHKLSFIRRFNGEHGSNRDQKLGRAGLEPCLDGSDHGPAVGTWACSGNTSNSSYFDTDYGYIVPYSKGYNYDEYRSSRDRKNRRKWTEWQNHQPNRNGLRIHTTRSTHDSLICDINQPQQNWLQKTNDLHSNTYMHTWVNLSIIPF